MCVILIIHICYILNMNSYSSILKKKEVNLQNTITIVIYNFLKKLKANTLTHIYLS